MPKPSTVSFHFNVASGYQRYSVLPKFFFHVEGHYCLKGADRLSKLVLGVRYTQAEMKQEVNQEADFYVRQVMLVIRVSVSVSCGVGV